MRARFYTIPFNQQAVKLSSFLEQSLAEIAIAFGHSFVMKNVLPEEVPMLMREENALIQFMGSQKDILKAAEGLELFASECFINHSDAEASLLKSEKLFQGSVLRPLDEKHAKLAALKGYLQARQKTIDAEVPAVVTCENMVSVMLHLIQHPEKMGRLVCDYHAGKTLEQTALLLSGGACYRFETLLSNHGIVRAVAVSDEPDDPESVSPFGMYYAAAHALQKEMKLEQESNCLIAAVENVLNATWRTKDCMTTEDQKLATTEQICSLIDEQISLVGELINH